MYDVCIQAKHNQKFIRTKVKRTTKLFELAYSDKKAKTCTAAYQTFQKIEAMGYTIKRFRCDNKRGEMESLSK